MDNQQEPGLHSGIEIQFHARLEQRIATEVKNAFDEKQPYDQIRKRITEAEMRKFYASYLLEVRRRYGVATMSNAARYTADDRSNFRRRLKQYGLDMDRLLSEPAPSDEGVPIQMLERGGVYYHREHVAHVIEAQYLKLLMTATGGCISSAARKIGDDRSNFRRRLKQYGITPDSINNRLLATTFITTT
ncbi:hypothetical protein HYY69_07350 [Candidatus Woesearchaeota archaeon]|nr:hypothetical protein [Candidatus Woesearchaeota archaeon]